MQETPKLSTDPKKVVRSMHAQKTQQELIQPSGPCWQPVRAAAGCDPGPGQPGAEAGQLVSSNSKSKLRTALWDTGFCPKSLLCNLDTKVEHPPPHILRDSIFWGRQGEFFPKEAKNQVRRWQQLGEQDGLAGMDPSHTGDALGFCPLYPMRFHPLKGNDWGWSCLTGL